MRSAVIRNRVVNQRVVAAISTTPTPINPHHDPWPLLEPANTTAIRAGIARTNSMTG